MMRNAFIWGSMLLALAGCGGKDGFRLIRFNQNGLSRIRLNQPLVFLFSGEIDPSSITEETARIITDRGEDAVGRWQVRAGELRFLPRVPIEPDCSDAGLAPGRTYAVNLKGYPAYQSIRSTEGLPLNWSCAFRFATMAPNSGDRLSLFVDPEPETGPRIISVGGEAFPRQDFRGAEVKPGSTLELVFSEPLFPGSVFGRSGEIHVIYKQDGLVVDQAPLAVSSTITGKEPRGAVVALEPEGGFQKDRQYTLSLKGLEFRDFGGRSLETAARLSIACTGEPSDSRW